MDVVKFVCTKDDFKGEADVRVQLFDAFKNYDLLNEFFGKHDKKLMEDKATYFDGYDFQAWNDYVIIENGEIISRAGIWKVNGTEWEVAGVSTLPEYRKQGYGEAVVQSCIAKILESGKTATCTTKTTNTAMINTALKAGFKIVK
ncbi:MAG: GNAT family N-acetyltransferase [Clostridia bacterium]|nr:GNAT family N-acetyltransferase [Clostridia bacterium]